MEEIIKFWPMLITSIFGIGSVYGLIRADLKHMMERVTRQDRDIERVNASVARAHERLDAHIMNYHKDK